MSYYYFLFLFIFSPAIPILRVPMLRPLRPPSTEEYTYIENPTPSFLLSLLHDPPTIQHHSPQLHPIESATPSPIVPLIPSLPPCQSSPEAGPGVRPTDAQAQVPAVVEVAIPPPPSEKALGKRRALELPEQRLPGSPTGVAHHPSTIPSSKGTPARLESPPESPASHTPAPTTRATSPDPDVDAPSSPLCSPCEQPAASPSPAATLRSAGGRPSVQRSGTPDNDDGDDNDDARSDAFPPVAAGGSPMPVSDSDVEMGAEYDEGDYMEEDDEWKPGPSTKKATGSKARGKAKATGRRRKAATAKKLKNAKKAEETVQQRQKKETATTTKTKRARSATQSIIRHCPECDILVQAQQLPRHLRSVHRGETKYPCLYPGCDKVLSRKDAYGRHARDIHGGEPLPQ